MNKLIERLVVKYPDLTCCLADIDQAVELLKAAYSRGGKLLICGNGGSAADCEHIVGELMKGFNSPRELPKEQRNVLISAFAEEGGYLAEHLQGALPAISLVSHSALMTAYANDVEADMVFAQQVYGYGQPGDVLIGLSTSGNSRNVIRAMQVARAFGLRTIAFTGHSGGKLLGLADVTIRVPYEQTLDIQERHLPIYHTICLSLEEAFFANGLLSGN
ncbi:phosphoheptose isomerase [Paenibacillus sp. FSL H8-0548]|uniref:D-sedoheptulose-7-phosphate isomerase n=1 Tax=Paenibacillus sp. FSL H8-0548 TaxID=1920422 RepID=UPI00096E6C3D|nr:SIS domain-containing protein [Paenibacillus sp. FSL H8-0548]OMF26503.1 phosphoheptose isomerase [Paenibacillus sp. FSL H8-0548]